MSRCLSFKPDAAEVGQRLDTVVATRSGELSRSLVRQLILDGEVLVNGQVTKPAHRLASGDTVEANLDPPPSLTALPEDLPLAVVYRDRDIAVIDKPAGLVVHPAAGHRSGTLANAIAALFPTTSGVGSRERPGIVHRLDKDTSGLIAIALSVRGQTSLQTQFASRTAGREYLAVCAGGLAMQSGVIDIPIGRDPAHRRKMSPYGTAFRPARTAYRVIEELAGFTLVEAKLQSGRTHQIRVHFSAIGHPVAGDVIYGGPRVPGLSRQFLHAFRLSFMTPSTGERVSLESSLPLELARVLDSLRPKRTSAGLDDIVT